MHPPTFGEFVHEFVGHYVALEGALWRTMRAVYGGGWLATLGRAAFVAALYGVALVAAIAALFGAALSAA